MLLFHQVRERRFVPTRFVDIPESALSDDVVLEEQAKKVLGYTFSCRTCSTAKKVRLRQVVPFLPKAIANAR